MASHDANSAREAVADYVTGESLEFGSASAGTFSGARLIDRDAGQSYEDLSGIESDSIDSIVAVWSVEHALDLFGAVTEWRRVLKDNGKLAVVIRDGTNPSSWGHAPHSFTADTWQTLLRQVGGFAVTRVAEIADGGGWLIVAEHKTVLELRNILGVQGATLADAALRNQENRAELCFQLGTILLRAGESTASIACFHSMLVVDPNNSECLFGLGMCHALQKRWAEAEDWLQRAVDVDPDNPEARRWLGLAKLEIAAQGVGDVSPQSMQIGNGVIAPK